MGNPAPKTTLRDDRGPRAVDSGSNGNYRRGSGRRQKDSDGREKHHSRRGDSHRPSKKDGHRRRLSSASNSQTSSNHIERPTLELTVVKQPSRGIQLGMPVDTSVVLSVRRPLSDRSVNVNSIDIPRLFGITSLVAETSSGERSPMEAGSVTGQKTYDSVHSLPEDSATTFSRLHPDLAALGYFSFPGLVIRQAGTYRIRTTLAKVDEDGAASLLAVDSEPVKVERRGSVTSSQRRQHRMYG